MLKLNMFVIPCRRLNASLDWVFFVEFVDRKKKYGITPTTRREDEEIRDTFSTSILAVAVERCPQTLI